MGTLERLMPAILGGLSLGAIGIGAVLSQPHDAGTDHVPDPPGLRFEQAPDSVTTSTAGVDLLLVRAKAVDAKVRSAARQMRMVQDRVVDEGFEAARRDR